MTTAGYGPAYDGTGEWEAAMIHPTAWRFIVGRGTDESGCKTAFVDAYNTELNESATVDDFDWVRNIKVQAEIYEVPEGFMCFADTVTTTGETAEEAQALFVTVWNDSHGTQFEPIEFGFTPNSWRKR